MGIVALFDRGFPRPPDGLTEPKRHSQSRQLAIRVPEKAFTPDETEMFEPLKCRAKNQVHAERRNPPAEVQTRRL
ncbi:hypothetical protein [Brevundimonas sp. TWP2-3-4b2]|uniref:hypothetical protein n=1 Tax=Brevundimonas sp. TWP2-3-4b2 TaxID=2804595 RepID=UPI003CF9825D